MNTLTQLFDWLLAASLRASLLTLAVLLIQTALRQHLSARMRYALWLPVLVVLLMPVLPQSRWSIEYAFHSPPQSVQVTPKAAAQTLAPAPVVFNAAPAMPAPINWQRIRLITWITVPQAFSSLAASHSCLRCVASNKHVILPATNCSPRLLKSPAKCAYTAFRRS